jgi:hypothetical protein
LATAPSDEEMLEAVQRHIARRGITTNLTTPGAAEFSRQQLLDFRIVRCIETREQRPRRVPGRRSDLAKRPTYTGGLDDYPFDPPADPAVSRSLRLVREGSLEEVACGGCEGGRKDCEACEGRGGRDCPRHVDCDVCEGGPDACWECDGTGTPRTRRAVRAARRSPEAARRATCERCERPDVACPKCLGRRQLDCPACKKSGFVACKDCAGRKRIRHEPCAGTGCFTTWTEGFIGYAPEEDEEKRLAPFHVRMSMDGTAQWSTTVLTSAADKLPDELQAAHRELLAPRLSVGDKEVRRQVTVRHLPLARVTVHADPHRVYYAFPGRAGIEVLDRPSKQRVLHVTARASAALTLVVLAAALIVTLLR